MEEQKSTKKVRKPRTKKQFIEAANDVQIVEHVVEQLIVQKESVIIGIDPAFKKCGIAVISKETGKYIESFQTALRTDDKLLQSVVDAQLSVNIQKIIDSIFDKYEVDCVVIELQLGQFACDRIQLGFVMALAKTVKFVVQHSKLKLKHPEIKNLAASNIDSNKYNQNKNVGKQLCFLLFPNFSNIDEFSTDEADALLHCKYVYRNYEKITFVKKSDI